MEAKEIFKELQNNFKDDLGDLWDKNKEGFVNYAETLAKLYLLKATDSGSDSIDIAINHAKFHINIIKASLLTDAEDALLNNLQKGLNIFLNMVVVAGKAVLAKN